MPILSGVKVLDFGQFIAGPYCAAMLAAQGADVIRIEPPEGGADRWVQPLDVQEQLGAVYLQVNQNKRSLAIDLRQASAQQVLKVLLSDADVVVANMPPDVLHAMGLSYGQLKAAKPGIILASCNAYGVEGDVATRPGFDGVAQAMSGAMHMTGNDGTPHKAYAHYADFHTAGMLAYGVVLALYERDKTGKGQHVQGSLLGSAVSMMGAGLLEQHVKKSNRQGSGNRAQLAAPADVYQCADGFVILQVIGARMFKRWTRLIGREDLLDDRQYSSDSLRGEKGVQLSQLMHDWCNNKSVSDVLCQASVLRLPCAPVYSFQQVLDDPAIQQQGFWRSQELEGLDGEVPMMTVPIKLSDSEALHGSAPVLGAHNSQILTELGFDDDEI